MANAHTAIARRAPLPTPARRLILTLTRAAVSGTSFGRLGPSLAENVAPHGEDALDWRVRAQHPRYERQAVRRSASKARAPARARSVRWSRHSSPAGRLAQARVPPRAKSYFCWKSWKGILPLTSTLESAKFSEQPGLFSRTVSIRFDPKDGEFHPEIDPFVDGRAESREVSELALHGGDLVPANEARGVFPLAGDAELIVGPVLLRGRRFAATPRYPADVVLLGQASRS